MSDHDQYEEPAMLPMSALVVAYVNSQWPPVLARDYSRNMQMAKLMLVTHAPDNATHRYIQRARTFEGCLEFMWHCAQCIAESVRPCPMEWGLPSNVYNYLLNLMHDLTRYMGVIKEQYKHTELSPAPEGSVV